jgi:Fe-S cluster assembly protein SufD
MNGALPLDALRRVIRELPGGFSPAREAALASFAEQGFPTVRNENWKYTDLARVIETSRGWLLAGGERAAPDLAQIEAIRSRIDAHWLVLANGVLCEDVADAAALALLGAAAVGGADNDFREPLSDLNAALTHRELHLLFGKGFRNEKPVAILLADTAGTSPVVSQARVSVRVDDAVRASLIEYHVSSGSAAHYSNALVKLNLGTGAGCRYVRIQERALGHSQTARLDVRLGRDAELEHFGIDIGGGLARNDLALAIEGRNSTAILNGLYLAGPGQHVDNHTRTDHRVGPARSRQEYRGVLSGRCRAVWNGKAVVHRGADGTDLEQANHNLLLSEHAEIDAKPELEIYADDVKAAHGTTVGQLDERALFYLRTRGIGPARARRILTRAFAATVIDTVPIAALRELLGDKVEARLRAMAAGESE